MKPTELKSWRKKNGISQGKLAKVLGVTSNTVARWERGKRKKIPPFLHLALRCVEADRREATDLTKNTRTNRKQKKTEKGD